MRLFGLEIRRAKASIATTVSNRWGWLGSAFESFSGAWQRGVTVDSQETLLAFSAVYSCVTLIADDISKLRIKLMQNIGGIWQETTSPAFSPVLRKPNNYQTRIQFLSAWIASKLLNGNTYVLKERDDRKVVVGLHILDPRRVLVLITTEGDVYYQLQQDNLTGLAGPITVPASEVIHDRAICFFHPLIGVGPIFACGISATQGNRIQSNSAKFFENMSRPSGQLTAPETISDDTAARLKAEFEANFSGQNIGRLLVTGDGLKYEPMTIPADQAQLIEQLRWTVEDVARCFHVPLHKIGAATNVKFSNMAEMNQDYYSQTLQALIEAIELLLDEGLGLTGGTQTLGVELDLEGLLRMDPVQRAQRNETAIKAGYMAPNEARATESLLPVDGGSEPYLQQQNFPLSVLAKQPPPSAAQPAPSPAPVKGIDDITVSKLSILAERMDAYVTKAAEMAHAIEEESGARAAELQRASEEVHRRAEEALIAASAAADQNLQRHLDAIQASADAALARQTEILERDRAAAPPTDDEDQAEELRELAKALIDRFSVA